MPDPNPDTIYMQQPRPERAYGQRTWDVDRVYDDDVEYIRADPAVVKQWLYSRPVHDVEDLYDNNDLGPPSVPHPASKMGRYLAEHTGPGDPCGVRRT